VETWAELYADPDTARVLDEFWRSGIEDGKATVLDHQAFLLRNGERLEERIFNLSLLPIFDANGETVGFYEPLTEITTDHLNERRSESVRRIGELTAGEEDPEVFFQSIMRALADNGKDFPFALLYSMGSAIRDRSQTFSLKDAIDHGVARLESFLGVALGSDGKPLVHELLVNDESFVDTVKAVCALGEIKVFNLMDRPDIKAKIMEDPPTRGFGDEPYSAVICPIEPTTHKGVVAVLVVGVNPRRPYDADYDSFVRGLARSISSGLASVMLVNEQKRLTGKAVEQEQRAMAMIAVSPVGSFLIDMAGKILYANKSVSAFHQRVRILMTNEL
jgi:PAS domain-containing protein